MANADPTGDARDRLKEIWISGGKPTGDFRPRFRPNSEGGGWMDMLCVDKHEQVIRGLRSVKYRPVATGSSGIKRLTSQDSEKSATA